MTAVSSLLSSTQITSLIQQASNAYQAPANALQTQEKPIEAEISDLGKVQSALSSLQSAFAALSDVQSLPQRTAASSPSGVVSASVVNTAAIGTYNLANIRLARAESLVSAGFASASASLGSGALAISVGGGPSRQVAVGAGTDSLAGVAAAINNADLGVAAGVVYDGAAYHLVLTAANSGTPGAFTVSGSGGLTAFSYGPGASGLSLSQTATNASFSLNGITITSGSNTITGAVPGLTLTLAASGTATVTVSADGSALAKAASSVASALNNVLSTIDQYSSYSTTSGAGPLLGDVGLQVLRNNLIDAITGPASGLAQGAPYGSLSAIGFTFTSGGTLSLNQQVFADATRSNYAAVAGLLGASASADNPAVTVQQVGGAADGLYAVEITGNTGGTVVGTVNGLAASGTGGILVVNGAGPANGLALSIAPAASGALGTVTVTSGLFGRLSSVVGSALASGSGGVTGEIASLNNTLAAMNKQIGALQQQAQQQVSALTQQYSTAQATLSQLTTVSNFLTSYFNQTSGG